MRDLHGGEVFDRSGKRRRREREPRTKDEKRREELVCRSALNLGPGDNSMAATSLLAIFVWPGLLLWAIIVFFMAGRGIPPLNMSRRCPGRKLLGVVAFAIPALILMSMPDGMSSATRTSCVVLIWERSDLPARPQRTNTALFEVHRLKVTPGAGKAASCVRRLADRLHRSCEQR
jgi:hypothetical protein